MAATYGLSKSERLHHKEDIQKIFDMGRRLSHPWVSLVVRHPTEKPLRRLAIMASRKYGNAVQRNRIKRLIREVFRLNKHDIKPGTDMIFLPRSPAQGTSFHSLEQVLIPLWIRAHVWTGK